MLKTALAGVRAHSRRLAGTVLAVMLGVGFVTGTLIFGDTVREGYFQTFARAAQNVDAVVVSPSAQDVARIRAVSDVEAFEVRWWPPCRCSTAPGGRSPTSGGWA